MNKPITNRYTAGMLASSLSVLIFGFGGGCEKQVQEAGTYVDRPALATAGLPLDRALFFADGLPHDKDRGSAGSQPGR